MDVASGGGDDGVDVSLPPGRHSWRALREHARTVLDASRVPGVAPAEVGWLLERAGGLDPAELAAAVDEPASARAIGFLETMLARRCAGEPLQHVLGIWQFRDLEVVVDGRALIPRPETEIVAEVAIAEAERLGVRRGRPDDWGVADPSHVVVDLGTGSGVLALALVSELPDAAVWATDRSAEALALARANLAAVGLSAARVRLAEGDWFDALPRELVGRIALVVANPPYLAEHEHDALEPVVRDHEPRSALVSGPTGLEDIERVLRGALEWLARPGTIVVEHAPHQAEAVVALARVLGFTDVEDRLDLARRPRALVARC